MATTDFIFHPAMSVVRWFHAGVSSKTAEALLMRRGQAGSFLVHPSASNPGSFTLSVRVEDDVKHIRIQNNGDFLDLYGGEIFATLPELVQYYMEGNVPLRENDGQLILIKYPLHDEEPTLQMWFHGKMTGKDAEVALTSLGENGRFLVRESLSKPGEFVISTFFEGHVTHVLVQRHDGMYDLGKAPSFSDLSQLVDHFMSLSITSSDGHDYYQLQPLNGTRMTAATIGHRMTLLKTEGITAEFERMQAIELGNSHALTEGQRAENKPKNRFKNILPYDHSRVVLEDGDPAVPASDYINANRVQIRHCQKTYLATQGCLGHTIVDFWRMVYQERSQIIAMTTKIVETGKNKCAKYWPDKASPELIKDVYQGKLKINWVAEETNGHFTTREMTVCKLTDGQTAPPEPLRVFQFHYNLWPDKLVPERPSTFLHFLAAVQAKHKEIEGNGPITMHCSAGIGRTGTTIILDALTSIIQEYGDGCEIDIQRSLLEARLGRAGLVQTALQYQFVYSTLSQYDAMKNQHEEPAPDDLPEAETRPPPTPRNPTINPRNEVYVNMDI